MNIVNIFHFLHNSYYNMLVLINVQYDSLEMGAETEVFA